LQCRHPRFERGDPVLQILNVVEQPVDLFIERPQVNENEIVGLATHGCSYGWLRERIQAAGRSC
jgi:hypothetical protein